MNPYTPEPPRKSWPRRHKVLTGLGIAVAVITGAGIASAGSQPKHVTTAAAQPSDTPSTTYTPPPAPVNTPAPSPSPDGTVSYSCDSSLAAGIYGTNWLTGEADLQNTGNIGIVVRVKFKWHQEAYPDAVAPVRTVRLKTGASKVVRFHYNAGTFSGSTAPLDRWQSWQDSHSGIPCHASVHMVSTFGQAS